MALLIGNAIGFVAALFDQLDNVVDVLGWESVGTFIVRAVFIRAHPKPLTYSTVAHFILFIPLCVVIILFSDSSLIPSYWKCFTILVF